MHSTLAANVSVVISGAGPTGLTAANLLGQAGIETLVIERNAATCAFPRAIAIDDEGLRILQACGLREEILAHARLNVQAHYVSLHNFLAKVAPQECRNGFPLLSTFHQPTLERMLLKGLERFSCVNVHFEHTLTSFAQDEHGVHITVRTPDDHLLMLECAYLLACDGGKSLVRRLLTIPMHPPGRGRAHDAQLQKWLVVDAIGESEPSDTIFFFCDPARPAVSVPGPGTQRRWEFMLLPGEQEENLLDTTAITQLITCAQQAIPHEQHSASAPLQITRQTIYTFHALIATHFAQGRTFLLGDAAHLMPPFGGQGMNSGLRDVHNLCWKLHMVLQNMADTTLLASYHKERYPHVAQMILFSSFLGRVMMTTQRPTALVRDLCLRIIDKLPPARAMLTEMRIKPQPRYKDGFLLKNAVRGMRKLVGAFFPQPYVLTQEGKRVLLDEVMGNGFALIRLYEGTDAFSGIKHPLWERLQVRLITVKSSLHKEHVTVVEETPLAHLHSYVIDSEQGISNFLCHRYDIYVLVRPDRYVMGVCSVSQIRQFEEELQNSHLTYP